MMYEMGKLLALLKKLLRWFGWFQGEDMGKDSL